MCIRDRFPSPASPPPFTQDALGALFNEGAGIPFLDQRIAAQTCLESAGKCLDAWHAKLAGEVNSSIDQLATRLLSLSLIHI
eukprot:1341136-Alexandrium_andersonii.AAC.1